MIKRDTIDGDKAKEAVTRMRKAASKLERTKNKIVKEAVVDVVD
ncbi:MULTISPECIES: hypothetical protein [unclassified Mesorhizobium]|nr:hypothetical protein [Mesorhizobium sp. LMG 17147]